jgi:hypothetical protein
MNILLDVYRDKNDKWNDQYDECMKIKQETGKYPTTKDKRLF